MATSFFEKLTGASSESEEKSKELETSKTKEKRATARKEQKNIKKDYLNMPKSKKETTEENKEKSPVLEVEEDKGWLEEAEGEEGQLTIDVYQTESDIVIKSTIAGVSPEDIDISITNDMVTIKGRRVKDEKIKTESYYYQELYWGAFSRSVILPVEVDADRARATIKNGILTIRLPKSEKIKTKKIKVRPAD